MKLTVKLPGGGYIQYEKKPMSEEARAAMWGGMLFLCSIGALLVMLWMFR